MKSIKVSITLMSLLVLGACETYIVEESTSSSSTTSSSTSSSSSSSGTTWVTQLGDTTMGAAADGNEYSKSVVVDSEGNVYSSGITYGSLADTLAGASDFFFSKFDSDGNKVWVKQLGTSTAGYDTSSMEAGGSMVIDSSGNLYFCGGTGGDFVEPFGGVTYDVIYGKLNSDGDIQWIKQWGDTTKGVNADGLDVCQAIVLDSSGNIYLHGYTGGNLADTLGGTYDVWVAKLDSSGNEVWLTQLGTSVGGIDSSGNETSSAMDVDSSGNVYITFRASGDFTETNGGGGADMVVAKLDSSGNFSWATQFGDTTVGAGADTFDAPTDLVLDSSGNAYVSFYTRGDFAEVNTGGNNDVGLTKVDSSGNVSWTSQMGATTIGAGASQGEYPTSIALNSNGDIFMGVITQGDLGETNGGSDDVALVKYYSSGTYAGITHIGSVTASGGQSSSTDTTSGLAFDSSDNIYIGVTTMSDMGETNADTGNTRDFAIIKFNSSMDAPSF